MTRDLEHLAAWLRAEQVEQVALESSGVYWWPVFNLLEEAGLPVLLVNPQQRKTLAGQKTDIKDAVWLADLLRHGLLRASFIPPAEIRALRELTRYRAAPVRQRAYEINRLQKVLESANIKLAEVATDVLGVSGRHMLLALARGEDDPHTLAQLAKAGLRTKLDALQYALEGRVKPHHRLLIRTILDHIRFLETAIVHLDGAIEAALVPFAAQRTLLEQIPGSGKVAAAAIIAEIGGEISRPRQYPCRTCSLAAGIHHRRRSDALPLWPDPSAAGCHHKEVRRAGLCRRPGGRSRGPDPGRGHRSGRRRAAAVFVPPVDRGDRGLPRRGRGPPRRPGGGCRCPRQPSDRPTHASAAYQPAP
jgi:transposase